ncbi:DegT/DnrJ/EryC1/StrS family aminotransferase [Humibacter sp.]|uniref:DegT/DnrJ/EryC1/StrS family aminotransferase n=1 Tax=Humibacter sp. TaxID=1940291 RepID=UPI003F7DC4DA
MIPISTVRLGQEVEESVLSVIRSGIIAQGPVVARFEEEFASLTGARHAVAVNNGTTALVAALQTQNLEPGDEVVTSPFTFIATINAALEAGATVRFADVLEADFGLDPQAVDAQITDRTKVLMPVHLYGQSADMAPLAATASLHGVAIIEDAAQAHGATYSGQCVGTFGAAGCFSFYATKNLTTGEGGIITTNDDEIATTLRLLRNQGMRERYNYVLPGHNYRLTDLQAAVVLPQLAEYDQQLACRRRNAEGLSKRLKGLEGVTLPTQLPGRKHVWHQYTILLPDGVDRDSFIASLTQSDVGSGIYYPKPVYDYAAYREHPRVLVGSNPVAESIAKRCVSLPVHQYLEEHDLDIIAEAVRGALR